MQRLRKKAVFDLKDPILVSACLAGFPCRYDGKSKPVAEVVRLVEEGKAIPFCPEVEGGLDTPRIPAEIRDGRVVREDGADVTGAYRRGAEKALALSKEKGIRKAVLKAKSPSCGCGKVYDGTFTGTLKDGDGVTASLLKKAGIDVLTEETFLEDNKTEQ